MGAGALLVLVLLLGALVVPRMTDRPGAPTQTRPPHGVRLYVPVNPYELTEDQVAQVLDTYRDGGASGVLTGFFLPYACPRKGHCDTGPLDHLITEARRRGLGVAVQLVGVADWMRPRPVPGAARVREWTMPRDAHTRGEFARVVGTFAEQQKGRVERYEVWNEPNTDEFTAAAPSPREYALLYWAVRERLRKAAPDAVVSTGGVSRGDGGFVGKVLDELADDPPDEVGVHPYAPGTAPWDRSPALVRAGRWGVVDENASGWRTVLRELDRRGLTKVPLWVGEFGYSSNRTWMPAVPDSLRAVYAAAWWEEMSGSPRVAGAAWFSGATAETKDSWALIAVGPDGRLRPTQTWLVLSHVMRGGERLTRRAGAACVTPTGQASLPCLLPDRAGTDLRWTAVGRDGTLRHGTGPDVTGVAPPWRGFVTSAAGDVETMLHVEP